VENKKINVLFYLVVVFFLALIFILLKDLNAQRANDYKVYRNVVANVVRMENDRIRILAKENADLKNVLAETRNALDIVNKRLAQSAPVAARP
jgi:signal transduction histidine kinase